MGNETFAKYSVTSSGKILTKRVRVLRIIDLIETLHVCKFSHSVQENITLSRQLLNSFRDTYHCLDYRFITKLLQTTIVVQQN